MQQVYSNTSKVMVDSKGQGNLLYLPLDKLMQASGAIPSGATSVGSSSEMPAQIRNGPAASNEPPPPQVVERTESRSRDSLRSREREAR